MDNNEVVIYGTVMQQVLLDPKISKSAKALYALYTTYRHRGTNQAWITNEVISEALGSDRQDIRKWLHELRDAGYISIDIVKKWEKNYNIRIVTFTDGYKTKE